ncbi:MAG: DUF4271 domain-containing protein [Chitinophagaceae bacterium]|nr:DUF4271 domain-containing protein [Chitinophagaceae bacterium]
MRSIISFIIFQFFIVYALYAQDDSAVAKPQPDTAITPHIVDTTQKKVVKKKPVETAVIKKDSVAEVPMTAITVKEALPANQDTVKNTAFTYGDYSFPFINNHPFFNVKDGVVNMSSKLYRASNKDELFYIICATLLFLGILRVGFPKYFNDLFNVFWRSTRQKQIRDQLQQAGMTTLLFNIFFVFSLSLFAYLAVDYLTGTVENPWLMFGVCFFTIGAIYTFKYFILKFSGWIFGQEEAASTYSFIVFMINKILAVLLLPFILILAFSDKGIQQAAFSIAVISIIFILIYRFILAYSNLRNELKISGLHLFLYVAGFEIIPVLLIYRLLVDFFARSL